MQRFLFTLLFIAVVSPLFSQIPNASLENWSNAGVYEDPDQWGTLNASTASFSIFTITKGTSAPASGSAYAKLTTKDLGNGSIKPGIMVSGQLDIETLKPRSGFPFTGRPEKLKGKWQYMGFSGDAATISAWLTRWDPLLQQRDTVASLISKPSGMLHSWGTFNFSFTYYTGESPDTAVIMISSSGDNPVKNSFIWIDDLSFDGNVTGINKKENLTSLSLYPNPASQYVHIGINSMSYGKALVRLSDNIGNQVMEKEDELNPGQNQLSLDLSSGKIRSGVYLLKVETGTATFTRKLVIKK